MHRRESCHTVCLLLLPPNSKSPEREQFSRTPSKSRKLQDMLIEVGEVFSTCCPEEVASVDGYKTARYSIISLDSSGHFVIDSKDRYMVEL